jgi:hypothetical protein
VLHGRPPMMLGAGSRLTPVNDTITLRDDHPCHLALATGPLRHLDQPMNRFTAMTALVPPNAKRY